MNAASSQTNPVAHVELSDFVTRTAESFGIPGVAVGVWAGGQEVYACHGVTSIENPLPVDQDTLFLLGSITKTYTATALMRLVAELLTVPERDFAVIALSNAGPDGTPFNQAVVQWALETYLGVTEREAEPLPYDETRAREVVGRYENDAMTLTIGTDGAGLTIEVLLKPEVRAALDTDPGPDYPPAAIGLLPGDGDEYILTDGGMRGLRGFFTRDETGAVKGVDMAGRLFTRITTIPQ